MEEVLPPGTEQGAGFEPRLVRQFTVFLENKVGRLQALVRAYEESGGRIRSVSVHNAADTALVRLLVSDSDRAREVLRAEGFAFAEQDVLVVQLPQANRLPLSTLCTALLGAEINIHYAYPLLDQPGGPAMVLCADDPTLAAQVLIRKLFTILGESDLGK